MTSNVACLGKDGFALSRPFPYKNSGGDICCVVCCLQQGRLFYQAPCHFKIFRERGAIVNEEREEWVTKVFGYTNLKGGRMCDKHYREMLKMKNGKGSRKKKDEDTNGEKHSGSSSMLTNHDNPDSCSSSSSSSVSTSKGGLLFDCLVKQLEGLVGCVNSNVDLNETSQKVKREEYESDCSDSSSDNDNTSESVDETEDDNRETCKTKYAKKVKRENVYQ
ncbi:hypothetical protein C9374_006917 [Naegleria lovaniensis]|uniref:Uncharacterized protein n=1 Tax=Naegleria lovaniensis TaxID=51637 RepID=A0AA88H634_NAELO|nr:uncharacterized protein C9374_006917 [Naegleria lovaniensis]KAG2393386.1 hypothetical protein C9374_006917 [Naegleria lovaniensis]